MSQTATMNKTGTYAYRDGMIVKVADMPSMRMNGEHCLDVAKAIADVNTEKQQAVRVKSAEAHAMENAKGGSIFNRGWFHR